MEQIFGRCTFHNVLLKICSIWNFSIFHYFAAPCTDNILQFVNVLLCLLPCMGVNFRYIYIFFLILSFCPFCSCCDDSFLSDGLLVLIISFLQIKDKLFLKYRTKYIVLANSHVFVAFWTVKTSLQVTWLLLSLAITLSLSGLPSALQLQSVFRDSFG